MYRDWIGSLFQRTHKQISLFINLRKVKFLCELQELKDTFSNEW